MLRPAEEEDRDGTGGESRDVRPEGDAADVLPHTYRPDAAQKLQEKPEAKEENRRNFDQFPEDKEGAARVVAVEMICRTCGTEIAEKALICYRCGEATTAPRLPPLAPRSRRLVPAARGIVLLVVAGLYGLYTIHIVSMFSMGQAAREAASSLLVWAIVGLALVGLTWRFWRR